MQFPIIQKLGGERAVFEHLKTKKLTKTIGAVRMWRTETRGVIPGDAARELMRWADQKKISYSASDFALAKEAGTA